MSSFAAITPRPLVFDGAWDPNLPYFAELYAAQRADERLTLPELPAHLLRRAHLDYAAAGCDVLQTFTWDFPDDPARQASSLTRATAIAREVADSVADRKCWVAGIVPPANSGLPTEITNAGVDANREQARRLATALIRGGVDLLVLALFNGKADALAAIQGAQDACAGAPLPILISFDVTLTALGLLLSGDELGQTLAECEAMGVYSAGAYLCNSPEQLPEPLFQSNGRHAFADAGYTGMEDGNWTWSMDAPSYGKFVAEQATRLRLRFCGGGWGLTPAHIGALRQSLGD